MKPVRLMRELLLWLVLAVPIGLLLIQWKQIPQTIPLHYGLDGKADRWGGKETLLWLVPVVSLIAYLVLLLIPFIDPKKRIGGMGGKYFSFRLLVQAILTAVLLLFLVSLYQQEVAFTDYLFPLLALVFLLVGNYLQAIKPNYFIGIRTPWALNDDDNWLRTHRFASRCLVLGGLVLLLVSLLGGPALRPFFLPVLLIILLIPVGYSYLLYRKK